MDVDGYCTSHKTIKLQRYNNSSGEWKVLLKECPLCCVTGTTPPQRRRGDERQLRDDSSGSSALSDSIGSSIHSTLSSLRRLDDTNNDDSPSSDDEEMNQTDHSCHSDDENDDDDDDDSITPLEEHHKPILCKQVSSLSITSGAASCDTTVASTCSGGSNSIHTLLGSTMGVGVHGGISDETTISPLEMMSPNVCQPCGDDIPSPPPPPPRRSSLPHPPSSYRTPPPPPPPQNLRRSWTASSASNNIPTTRKGLQRKGFAATDSNDDREVVCGLPYTNPTTRQAGAYTGQLNLHTKLPHGIGTLRYCSGHIIEGEWLDGVLVDQAFPAPITIIEKSSRNSSKADTPRGGRIRRNTSPHNSQSSNTSGPSEKKNSGRSTRSSRRRSSRHVASTSQEELAMPRLDGTDEGRLGSSWCQPCDDTDASSSSPSPSPPSYSPFNSYNGGSYQQPFICSPCTPPPPATHGTDRSQGAKQENRHVTKTKSSSSRKNKVEVALSQDLVLYSNQDSDEEYNVDFSESDNSLGVISRRSVMSATQSVKSSVSTKSRSSATKKRIVAQGPYSARESKSALPPPANALSRSASNVSSSNSGRLRRNFGEIKRNSLG